MNKVFEKIIEKLEEEKMSYFLTIANTGDEKLDCAYEQVGDALDKAIEIVKHEAEKYNNAIIDGKYCFQSCACTEKCDKCSRFCNGDIDWYENIDNWIEEYNNGWIPCSEKLPELRQDVLVTVKYTGFMGMHGYWIKTGHMEAENDWWGDCAGGEVIAWQPLPKPFQKGDNNENS